LFYFELFLFGFLGLVLGSFCTAIYYRESIGQPWWSLSKQDKYYKSLCPSCEHMLGFKDLMPVFSYLIQKGKCRYCGAPIARRYFLIELFCLFLSIVVYFVMGMKVISFFFVFSIPFGVSYILLGVLKAIFPSKLLLISGGLLLIGVVLQVTLL
tara:strand:- start:117 stop:578 length:462 start_codon:yes stop_codon:yes gene_type:complete